MLDAALILCYTIHMSYSDIKTSVSDNFCREATVGTLCWTWNILTNPAKLRTDEQHAQARVDAKVVLDTLRRRFMVGIHFTESDSGRLIPK